MSILITDQDNFTITVVVGVSASSPPKHVALLYTPDCLASALLKDLSVTTVNFEFKSIDARLNMLIVDSAVDIVGGKVRIHGAALRHARLLKTLTKWDLKDSKGNGVPLTEANINALSPVVCNVLSDELDRLQDGF
jgi:hypothetical protein